MEGVPMDECLSSTSDGGRLLDEAPVVPSGINEAEEVVVNKAEVEMDPSKPNVESASDPPIESVVGGMPEGGQSDGGDDDGPPENKACHKSTVLDGRAPRSLPRKHPDNRSIQVVVDVDDTIVSSGGYRLFTRHIGGIDTQYARGVAYPGVFQFLFELAYYNSRGAPRPLAVLTARIAQVPLARGSALDARLAQTAARRGVLDWGLGRVKYATLNEWIYPDQKAKKKYENFLLLIDEVGASHHGRLGKNCPPVDIFAEPSNSAADSKTAVDEATQGIPKDGASTAVAEDAPEGDDGNDEAPPADATIKNTLFKSDTYDKQLERVKTGAPEQCNDGSTTDMRGGESMADLPDIKAAHDGDAPPQAEPTEEDPTALSTPDGFIWIGDTGEMDAECGLLMARGRAGAMAGIYLHWVTRAPWENFRRAMPAPARAHGVPVVHFRTYAGAAAQALRLGHLGRHAVARVLIQAVLDLDALALPSYSSAWRDLLHDAQAAARAVRFADFKSAICRQVRGILARRASEYAVECGRRERDAINEGVRA